MKLRFLVTMTVPMLFAAACATQSPAPDDGLEVTGQASFDQPVSRAQALQNGTVVDEAKVSSDGAFALNLPVGSGYQLRFLYDGGEATLVFPRRGGTIDTSFDVTETGRFDLGKVRHVQDPSTKAFHFTGSSQNTSTTTAALVPETTGDQTDNEASETDGAENDGEHDDVECENGTTPDGAVCVDDDANEGASCDDQEGEADDDAGEAEDGDTEADDAGENTPGDAAVAEHNLPSTGGDCADDDADHECEDGIDPATGQPCDGGPAANQDDASEQSD